MLEISHRSDIKTETIFIGVYLLDQMLSIDRSVTTQNLQLLATATLFIACKYEEIYPIKITKFL
jgi:cyclin B